MTCHAIELALKAFLRLRGVPSKDLKNQLKHDLEKILLRVDAKGLVECVVLTKEQRAAVVHANKYYKAKVLEYFSGAEALRGYIDLPDLSVLDAAAQALIDGLKAPCTKALFPESAPTDVADPL